MIFSIKNKFFAGLYCASIAVFVLCNPASAQMADEDIFEELVQQETNSSGVLEGRGEELLSPKVYSELQTTLDGKKNLREPSVYPDEMITMFFTYWQHALLQEAKQQYNIATTNPATAAAAAQSQVSVNAIRELSLGGISYLSHKDWTVWLNGQRITPETIPETIMDIHVYNEHIEIKWFDEKTKIIYPVRLHAHERFNLDTRMFIPGTPN